MLTNKGKYGLKAMIALAGADPERPMLVSDLAERNEIPKRFLDAILGQLRNAGLVRSRKGPGGGYALTRPPEQIRVGQIIRVLDGPFAPIGCASRTAYQPCEDCGDIERCTVRLLMTQVRDAMASVLDRRTLAEMRAMAPSDQQVPFHQI
jgi:Rrf2 family protein